MGLSELEDLQQRYTRLEQLYSEAVRARDEAVEERDKATVLIALQLESETEELNKRIETLQSQNKKLYEENEDLKIRLGYAKDDISKLQQRHIVLQLEQEKCLQEKEDALALVEEFEHSRETGEVAKEEDKQGDEKMASEITDPAYSSVRDEIFTSASEKDLELEPRPPVTVKKTRLEDVFDVHEEVGKGKFGVVKKVTERSSKKVFAAKYIKLSSSNSGSSRADILREINIMNQLHHKRLVGLVDAFDLSRNIVMIMDFMSGGELFERVADADCLTEKEASFYMYQLLQGLQYMHMKNIVHLDLKPENIVCVSKDSWDIKLIDFGLAVELVPGVRMTALKGTPEFMAPEAVNFETISFATDMWSVGVIAYILLSGLSPLLGEDNNETLANVTAAEWDFEDESFDVISDEAKDFIGQLLVKNAKKRNTVKQCLEHDWMEKSASANAVKIDTKKLKQFLAKRRWQKSVNALVAVRRFSSLASFMNVKSRPSSAPSLSTLPSANEEEEETTDDEAMQEDKVQELLHDIGDKVNAALEENNEQIAIQPPVFKKEFNDISINEGETVSFEVDIENDSNCQLEWLKNGVKVTEGERFSLVNHGEGGYSLTIRDTQDDDSGEYHCVVENEAGRVTCGGKLSIESQSKSEETDEEDEEIDSSIEVPVFSQELHDVTANEHDTVTLEVIVSGNSTFELEWFKNAVYITESDRISLVKHEDGRFTLNIRDCEDDDTGEYCCVAQNEAGRVTCAGWLTVEVESVRSDDDEESEESEDDDIFVPKEFVEIREGDVQTYYCVEEEVGRGRFGIVKKCVELNTATRFCAKFIKSRHSQKEEFKREIDVMNALHHPRIIRLQDAFDEPRQIILIMEYARGGDLFARIDGDSLPEFEAVKILKQVLDALKFMHDQGFMHLDLKPQNVMFKNEEGSKIKLIDFSLTRKFDPQQETKISFGTAEFVAPEIVNYEPVTFSADMWAIGVIAYIMLSGESPFLCESEADTFSRITDARWEFSDVFDYVSKEAKDFISRLLLKDPKKRLTVDECLEHEWIKSPGFTGKRKSKNYSEGELAVDSNSNVVSPTELKRQESRKSDEQEIPFVANKLESKLKTLLCKLQNAEKENQELEEKLRDEEERADTLEDELHTSENCKKELEEKVSILETEKIDLSKKAKANSDVLKRVAETEGEKRALEDKLSEQTKYLENLSQKYDSLKEKMDNYDVLEEKAYLLERERKESRDMKQHLEEKIERFHAEKEELTQLNERNTLVNTNLENEISKLREDRDRFENQYVTLRSEKESLVEELTKRFGVLDEQKKALALEKIELETKLKTFENENKDLKLKLDSTAQELNDLKETAKQNAEEKDVDEMERVLINVKKQKAEAEKTCEDLASKLSKAYAELEQTKPSLNNDGVPVNQQEEISTLQEKVTSLEKERDSLEDDLDDREAEIDELKKEIEQLETDNKAKDSEIQNHKANLDSANEEIKMLQLKKNEADSEKLREAEGDFDKRVKDYDAMVDKLAKEVSALQEKLSAANQKNKDLEEKVKSSMQVKRGDAILENEIVVRSENRLENSPVSFDERPLHTKEQQSESGESGQVRNISVERRVNDGFLNKRESERNMTLKKDFEKLRMLLEEEEVKLAKEREKTRTLQVELENFEAEKKRGLKMYRELEEECDRLREELNDNASSQSQVEIRLREKLRTRLKNKEEEIEVLSKQVDLLRKEVQVIKEERDKGNTLYVNLAEKYNNLLKENRILEQEKQGMDQRDGKCRELEDSLQTRIQEVIKMKDEIESMRDNLRTLVHEKEEGMREYTFDRQQLEEQIQDEMKRADKLEKERSSLQGKVEEMQKDLNKRDLVAAADKKTINTYADEIKVLKDEKGNVVEEVEKLRKQSKNLLQDLERMGKEREEIESLKMEKQKALKEIEILRNENARLVQKSDEFDQIAADLNSLREEKIIGLREMGILREENEDQINKVMEDVEDLKIERENAIREIEILRGENQLLLQKVDQFDKMKRDFDSLKDDMENMIRLKEDVTALKIEKNKAQKKIEILTKENQLLLQKVDQFDKMRRDFDSFQDDLENTNRLKEDVKALKIEKDNAQKEIEILRGENELLLNKVDQFDKMKRDFHSLQDDLENTNRVKEEVTALKTEKNNAKKEIEILTNENDLLLRKLDGFEKLRQDFDKLRDEKVIGLRELDILKEENHVLHEELRTMKQSAELEENETLKKFKETLLREQEEVKRVHSDLRTVANEKEKVSKENETLKKERETLINRVEELSKNKEDCNAFREDKLSLLKELDRLNHENETRLQEFENVKAAKDILQKETQALTNDFERTREDLQTLQSHNENSLSELDNLRKQNEVLLAELKSFHSIKQDLKTSQEDKRLLQKNYRDLEVSLENQALEAMRLKKETTILKKKNEVLTKDLRRLQNNKSPLERQISIPVNADLAETEPECDQKADETAASQGIKRTENHILEEMIGEAKVKEEKISKVKENVGEVESLKQEIDFLQNEVEDLSEEHKELLQSYNVLQKKKGRLKEEFSALEKCMETKSKDLDKIVLENAQLRDDLRRLKEEYDSQGLKLEHAEKEIRDFAKENEELHQNHIDLEERYGRIRKLNRELEEDVDIERKYHAEVKSRNAELKKENAHIRQHIAKLHQEVDKLQEASETNRRDQGETKKPPHLEKKKSLVQMKKEELQARVAGEKPKNFGDENRKLKSDVESVNENYKAKQHDNEKTIASLEKEISSLRSSKEQAAALEKDLKQLQEKLDFEVKNRDNKDEEVKQKKKENDSLIYELESTRHRLVSNVLNPLQEANLPRALNVTAADISAGKNKGKVWSNIKENIVALIRDRERLTSENTILQQAYSRMSEEVQETGTECEELAKERRDSIQSLEGISEKDILSKEQDLNVLHDKIATDKENLASIQKRNKLLLLQIELMKQMQHTADQERDKLAAQKNLFATTDSRLAQLKLRRFQSMESVSFIKHEASLQQQGMDPIHNFLQGDDIASRQAQELTTQRYGSEEDEPSREEQLEVARELVKKNRQIFELEQEVDVLLRKIEESSCEKPMKEKMSSDVENFKLEILRLEGENSRLKELANDPLLASSQKKNETLEAMNNFLKSEKEELVLEIAAKNKKIEILERRVKELTKMRTSVVNGSKNGLCDKADEHINELDEELRKTKHRVAELQAELEHCNNSYNSRLRRELDEIEAKWTKRLRKECMELQSELSEKHNKDKQQWQKKEVELQNIIRQMKIVMDKRLGQAEIERKRLEQLVSSRSSSFHGSTVSLDSNSDDSGESPTPKPETSGDTPQPTDCLSDRELRRVAYKLNGEEWSQLGTFLGVGDKELVQLGGLSMGPQEKAFRILCVWRTRCRLGRAQMISQLAVSLEEVNRKDVAQFVLEQFMSGKPRKKFFGW